MDREIHDPTMDVPPPEQNPADGVHRVLVVADERFRGSDFLDELRSHMKGAKATVEVFVVAPALAETALEYEMADYDGPAEEARSRLASILEELKGQGINAIGHVGDGDPVTAVGDGLREFPADEVVVVSHPDSERAPAEKDLWAHLKAEYRLPISDIEVPRPKPGEEPSGAIRVSHEPAKAHTEDELIRSTRNFPPVSRRDTGAMIAGLLGTFVIGVITVLAVSGGHGTITGRHAAIILIAIVAFILNGAHTVALLFFQSVHYTGFWERFMARTSLAFTAVGVPAALILWLA